jgi:PLP dependent protein
MDDCVSSDGEPRAEELRTRLAQVRARIATACAAADRSPDSVTLVVITKFFPANDVLILADLGVADVGESRHPEAADKRIACADLGVSEGLRWHYVGGIQSNKARAVASSMDVIHSVDRLKLVSALSRGSIESDRTSPLECLVQVSLDQPAPQGGRSGVNPAELVALADAVASAPGLILTGLMAVAPRTEDPPSAFERLARIRASFLVNHPQATWLSAGMSGDLEQAIAAGATHVRVGRSVLGLRPSVQ